MRFVPITLLGLLVAAGSALAPNAVAAQTFNCHASTEKTTVYGSVFRTKASTFTNVSGSAISVAQTGNDCLMFELSAQIQAEGGAKLRLTRDGAAVGIPDEANIFTGQRFDTRTVIFLVPTDATNAGSHIYRLQAESVDGTSVVQVAKYFLTARYNP